MRVVVFSLFALALAACGGASTECSPATCDGCCDPTGQCVGGTAFDACGGAGNQCNTCVNPQVCSAARRCEVLPADAGADAGPTEPIDAGQPIVAPVETWTWVDFPGSACGNGAPTGLGVNLSTRSKDVMIYLMGGGACWSGLTCSFGAASYITSGYTGATFAAEQVLQAAPFRRDVATNPFKDLSAVFVPYCTGDVHAGDAVQTYATQQGSMTVHHKGRHNLDVFLPRLKDTFPDAQHVYLAGSSAGAYGAQLLYEHVARAWPQAEVHLLADCGQMVTPTGTRLTEWTAAWKLELPRDCADCATQFEAYPAYLFNKYPQRRFALLAYEEDNTLRQFAGYSATDFKAKTLALAAQRYDGAANARYFIAPGPSHVMLDDLLTLTGPGNASLLTWTTQWLRGDAAWANVKP